MPIMTSLLKDRAGAGTADEGSETEERITEADSAAEAGLVLGESDVANGRKGDEDAGEEAKEDSDDDDGLNTNNS